MRPYEKSAGARFLLNDALNQFYGYTAPPFAKGGVVFAFANPMIWCNIIYIFKRRKMRMFTIRSISLDGEYYLVNGWQRQKLFWTKKLGEALFKTEASAKGSLTKLLKAMPDYLPDEFSIIELAGPDAPYSEWNIKAYVPKWSASGASGAKFVANVYGEIIYAKTLTALKSAASKIANSKMSAIDTMAVYDVEHAARVVFHRFNVVSPNNVIQYADWQ